MSAIQIEQLTLSNRDLERIILKQAGGCYEEDKVNRIYDISCDVILHANALAKYLHKIYGIDIGMDPRKRKLVRPRNFDLERAAIPTSDPYRRQRLTDLEREEDEYNQSQDRYNPEAWDAVIETEDRIMRRAFALQKAGLVVCNVDYLTPDAVSEREIMLGNEGGKVPLESTIALTEEGRRFLASGKTLQRDPDYSGPTVDEEVQIVN